jgi:hypothetical protein
MKETGPLATPVDSETGSPFFLNRENEKPVPPPDCWTKAANFKESKIWPKLSSIGITKQALN